MPARKARWGSDWLVGGLDMAAAGWGVLEAGSVSSRWGEESSRFVLRREKPSAKGPHSPGRA